MKHTNRFLSLSIVVLALGLQACVSVSVQADRIVSNKAVEFKTGSDEIKTSLLGFIGLGSASGTILSKVADILIHNPAITRVRIEGHTDAQGDAAHNQVLSTQRAVAVAAYLRAHHVTTAFETVGYGSSHPLCHETTNSCYARNRRVDFVILERAAAAGSAAPSASPAPAAH